MAPPYLRGGDGEGKGWSNAFSTVRMPLVDFVGVDLADVRFVRLEYGLDGDAPVGRFGLDDVEVE